MKPLVLACLLLAPLAARGAAAADFPPITDAERALTSVPEEPNAPAVMLFKKGELLMAGYGLLKESPSSLLRVQVRVKILTEAGRSKGEVVIAHSDVKRLHGFQARTVLPDGRIVPVPADVQFLSRTSRTHKTFTTAVVFPAVQVGAILDYQYELGFDSIFQLEPWYFSDELPVRYSEVIFKTPSNLAMQAWSRALVGVQVKRDLTASGFATRAWIENLPSVPEDPYGPPFKDLAAQMLLLPTARDTAYSHEPLFNSWANTCELVGRTYDQVRQRNNGVEAKAREIAGTGTPREKAQALYRFVRDQIEPDIYVGPIVAADAGLGKSLSQHQASRAEKALLLQAMLQAVGVDSQLVWAADRDRVTPDPQLPSPGWFDTVLVRVSLDGQPVYLDPTDRSLGFGRLRAGHQGTIALLYDVKKPEMIVLPETPFYKNLRRAEIDLALDEKGRLAGMGTLRLNGRQDGEARTAEDWKEWLGGRFHDFQISDVQAIEAIEDGTVTVTWKLAQRPDEVLGDETSIVPSAPFGPQIQPFVQPASSRRSGVVFGDLYREEVELKLRWPTGWTVESMPPERNLSAKAASISSRVQVNAAERTLVYKRRFDVSQRQLTTSQEYENVRNLFAEVEKNDAQKLSLVHR